MIGKGKQLKSWKDLDEKDTHVWVQWPSDTWGELRLKLLPISKRHKKGVWVRTEHGGELELTNPKSCVKVIGEVG